MTRKEFNQKAMKVLTRQKFVKGPLFSRDSTHPEDFVVSDDSGGLDLDAFLDEFFDELDKAEKTKTGHWIKEVTWDEANEKVFRTLICSCCYHSVFERETPNYCENCGARMESEVEEWHE